MDQKMGKGGGWWGKSSEWTGKYGARFRSGPDNDGGGGLMSGEKVGSIPQMHTEKWGDLSKMVYLSTPFLWYHN